jgi:outer membrane lipoprotein-sorting protein
MTLFSGNLGAFPVQGTGNRALRGSALTRSGPDRNPAGFATVAAAALPRHPSNPSRELPAARSLRKAQPPKANPRGGFAPILIAVLLLAAPQLWAISDSELLKKVDTLASYFGTDFSAQYTIVQNKPGGKPTTTVAGVFRRDSSETFVIVVMQPSISRGQGYLKQGQTLWFYDPESRRFNSTSNQDRFQNTNARNSDFTRSTLSEDYRVIQGEDARLGQYNCRVLTLEATAKEVTYPKMKIWVDEQGLLRKTEDYSLSSQLLRTTAIPEYVSMNGRYVPARILFVDALRGATINGKFVNEETQITITKPSFEKMPDSVFSKTFLEQVNR